MSRGGAGAQSSLHSISGHDDGNPIMERLNLIREAYMNRLFVMHAFGNNELMFVQRTSHSYKYSCKKSRNVVSTILFCFLMMLATLCAAKNLPDRVKCYIGSGHEFESACKSFGRQMEVRDVFHLYAAEWANAAFGVDQTGIAQIRTVVITFDGAGGQGEDLAQYSFDFHKVYFAFEKSGNAYLVRITCMSDEKKCITLTRREAAPINLEATELATIAEHHVVELARKNLQKIQQFFCPDLKACFDKENP